MKLSIILVLLLLAFAHGQETQEVKIKSGFRDVQFGDKLENLMDFVYANKEFDGYKLFRRPSDNLTLGEIPLDSITYWFWNGKLSKVVLLRDGTLIPSNKIKDFFRSLYGPATNESNDNKARYPFTTWVWEDNSTKVSVIIILDGFNTDSGITSQKQGIDIRISSKTIENEKLAADGKKNASIPNGM